MFSSCVELASHAVTVLYWQPDPLIGVGLCSIQHEGGGVCWPDQVHRASSALFIPPMDQSYTIHPVCRTRWVRHSCYSILIPTREIPKFLFFTQSLYYTLCNVPFKLTGNSKSLSSWISLQDHVKGQRCYFL